MTSPLDNLNKRDPQIEEHLSFAEELVYKYDWDLADRLDFESRLFRIKRKQQDERLNLSVVGEFGTGKSTLINALLRSDDFLVSSSLQGTTVAATIVENDSECGILLEHMNGQQEYRFFELIDDLREGIISCTTDPKIAQNLYNVRIRMPSEHLAVGFRIIDTPGLNANEKWHEKVTLRTIHEMSDMSVLIIDANKPLTFSFCEFVKLTLEDVLDQCVFLVTRIDMIRKRERQGVLDYLKIKVEKEFSLENPIVLPYASVAVLDELYGATSELANISHETETALLRHMKEKKESAQRKKIESLIDDMYYSLSDKLKPLSDSYHEDLDKLLRNRLVDLNPFVKEQNHLRTTTFEQTALRIRMGIIDNMEIYLNQAHQHILSEIDAQSTVAALKRYINNILSDRCIFAAQSLVNESAKESLALQELFSQEMNIFHSEFEKQFKDFDILKEDIHVQLFDNMSFSSLDLSSLDMSRGTASKLSWLLGPFIGSIVNLHSASLIKQTAKEKLYMSLRGFFADVINSIASGLLTYIQALKQSMSNEINKYIDTYQERIDDLIYQEEQDIAIAEEKINEIQLDMERVAQRKQSLSAHRKDVVL